MREAAAVRRDLVAVNTAADSENTMHGDEARRYGFSSGLVPGVDVLGYLAHEGVARWGTDWLTGGRLTGRLESPVYDGETVTVVGVETDSGLDAEVHGPDGDVRARGSLSLLRAEDGELQEDGDPNRATVMGRAAPSRFAAVELPAADDRPPASSDLLVPGTALGTQRARFHGDRAPSYLDELSEEHPAFRIDGVAHPGWLLRFANWALSRTVRLGPWIHVSSDLFLLAPVHDGDELEVRAAVTDRFERRGHELVDLDVLYLVDGTPVAFVDHRAIWQPRVTTA